MNKLWNSTESSRQFDDQDKIYEIILSNNMI